MKNIVFSFLLITLTLGSSFSVVPHSFAQGRMGGDIELPEDWDEMSEDEKKEYMEENRPEMRIPNDIELPDDWDDMTENEQREYLDENGGGKGEGRMGGSIELLEDWDEMSEDEKKEYMEENRPEGELNVPDDLELPDNWDDMTEDEQREYIQENRLLNDLGRRGVDIPEDWDEMSDEEKKAYMEENKSASQGDENNRLTAVKEIKTATTRKGKNYKKFTGNLEEAVEFEDEDDIDNLEAVQFLQQRGVINGYDDGTFRASNAISRAESMKILVEATGVSYSSGELTRSSFSDVSTDDWYFEYVEIAKQLGFISGYEDGTFRPGQTVSQSELLKIAFETFGIDLDDYEVIDLPTTADPTAWYAPYLQYALDNDLIEKDDILPGEGMTRGAFSEVIYRLIEQQESL